MRGGRKTHIHTVRREARYKTVAHLQISFIYVSACREKKNTSPLCIPTGFELKSIETASDAAVQSLTPRIKWNFIWVVFSHKKSLSFILFFPDSDCLSHTDQSHYLVWTTLWTKRGWFVSGMLCMPREAAFKSFLRRLPPNSSASLSWNKE